MAKKFFIATILFFIGSLCHAQKEGKTYYDSLDIKVSNPAKAYYYHVRDTARLKAKTKYYYPDGSLYAKGKGVWKKSEHNTYLERRGTWTYYYADGSKQQILKNKICVHYWYENGVTAYKGNKVYVLGFKGWYHKNRFWYANGQLKSSGLTSLDGEYKYGYCRFYNRGGRRRLEEYYAQSQQGVFVYTDAQWRTKYYITLDGSSLEDIPNNSVLINKTAGEPSFLEVKEGYNELIYDVDTFRFTVKNGYMEGPYYHRQGERKKSMGSYHRNYKTGHWQSINKGTRGNYIYHYNDYKKGCLHGNCILLLNDSMLLMKGRYRYDKRIGKWLIADGTMSDPRVMGDKDSLYFREEKFRHDTESRYYQNIYAAKRSDFSIKYLWIKKRKCFLSKKTIYIEYYPDHQVKDRLVRNEKKESAVEKLYDESGKLIGKKRISYKYKLLRDF